MGLVHVPSLWQNTSLLPSGTVPSTHSNVSLAPSTVEVGYIVLEFSTYTGAPQSAENKIYKIIVGSKRIKFLFMEVLLLLCFAKIRYSSGMHCIVWFCCWSLNNENCKSTYVCNTCLFLTRSRFSSTWFLWFLQFGWTCHKHKTWSSPRLCLRVWRSILEYPGVGHSLLLKNM